MGLLSLYNGTTVSSAHIRGFRRSCELCDDRDVPDVSIFHSAAASEADVLREEDGGRRADADSEAESPGGEEHEFNVRSVAVYVLCLRVGTGVGFHMHGGF